MLTEFPAFLRLTPARALPQDNPRSPEKLVTAICSIRMIENALRVRNRTVRKDYHSCRHAASDVRTLPELLMIDLMKEQKHVQGFCDWAFQDAGCG